MKQRSMFMNILIVIGLFFAGSIILSIVTGLISSLLWFVIKIMIPVVIVVWLLRLLKLPKGRRKYY